MRRKPGQPERFMHKYREMKLIIIFIWLSYVYAYTYVSFLFLSSRQTNTYGRIILACQPIRKIYTRICCAVGIFSVLFGHFLGIPLSTDTAHIRISIFLVVSCLVLFENKCIYLLYFYIHMHGCIICSRAWNKHNLRLDRNARIRSNVESSAKIRNCHSRRANLPNFFEEHTCLSRWRGFSCDYASVRPHQLFQIWVKNERPHLATVVVYIWRGLIMLVYKSSQSLAAYYCSQGSVNAQTLAQLAPSRHVPLFPALVKQHGSHITYSMRCVYIREIRDMASAWRQTAKKKLWIRMFNRNEKLFFIFCFFCGWNHSNRSYIIWQFTQRLYMKTAAISFFFVCCCSILLKWTILFTWMHSVESRARVHQSGFWLIRWRRSCDAAMRWHPSFVCFAHTQINHMIERANEAVCLSHTHTQTPFWRWQIAQIILSYR